MSENIKSDQIISILGPTATGKTALALQLADYFLEKGSSKRIHLLSADSRQIYQELEILTGADLPKDFQEEKDDVFSYPYFINSAKNIFLHGIKIISVKDEWSAAHFQKLFENLKKNIKNDEKIIIVGGSGFYHRQIEKSAASLGIKPDFSLREKLNQKTVTELQEILKKTDPQKLAKMNNSDINNPRRLIRAIEIAQNLQTEENKKDKLNYPKIYLSLPKTEIAKKIEKRVNQRFDQALKEVEKLLETKIDSKLPALTSTGFEFLTQYLKKEISKEKCITLWTQEELQYAKRQITWWKKETDLKEIAANDAQILNKSVKALID
jgi:tRNA dimethylallyltransferase